MSARIRCDIAGGDQDQSICCQSGYMPKSVVYEKQLFQKPFMFLLGIN